MAEVIGLPHSVHSGGVSGSVSSSIVLMTSTKGTSAMMPPKFSGAMLAIAPISMPPAEPPCATMRSWLVKPCSTRWRGRGDEIGEGVHLLQALAVLVPVIALVLAAANMGDGIDEAAIGQ